MVGDGCDLSGRGEFLFRLQSHSTFRWPPTRWWDCGSGVIKGPWSVTAFARNLTNKRAQISAINSSQDPDALLTVQPRTIGLDATRKF